jgi:serine protease
MRALRFASLLSVSLATAALSAPAYADAGMPVDRLIVKFRDSGTATTAAARSARVNDGLTRLRAAAGDSLARLRTLHGGALVLKLSAPRSHAQAARLAATLSTLAGVQYVEPDLRMVPTATPSDPRYANQWAYFDALSGMNLPAAWDQSQGQGVVVAVLDTGVRNHADLLPNLVSGYDFISASFIGNDGNARDSDASDPGDWSDIGECGGGEPQAFQPSSWHGTHVAGSIAAVANNGTGGLGVAYKAKIQPVRVLGKCGGYLSDIADAIVWASGGTVSGVPANATPAKVINMSLGSAVPSPCSQTYSSAINTARANGSVVIVAAGNSNESANDYTPSNCPGVVTVAATARNGARAYYSNVGSVVDVAAPGGAQSFGNDANGVLSTVDIGQRGPAGDGYAYYQGTSMATPHVSGVAALMLSAAPGKTPDQIEEALKLSTRPFLATCTGCGTGMVDGPQAIGYAKGTWTPGPLSNLKLELVGDNGKFVADPADNTRGTIRYIAKVTNLGPQQPVQVSLINEFPADVQLQSASVNGMTCNAGATQCSLGALAVGSQASVTLTFATSNKGKMTFKSAVSSELTDGDPSDNSLERRFGGSLGIMVFALMGLLLGRQRAARAQR